MVTTAEGVSKTATVSAITVSIKGVDDAKFHLPDLKVAGSNLDHGYEIFCGGENAWGPCAKIYVYVEGPHVIKISKSLHYSIYYNYILVLLHKTLAIILL